MNHGSKLGHLGSRVRTEGSRLGVHGPGPSRDSKPCECCEHLALGSSISTGHKFLDFCKDLCIRTKSPRYKLE